MLAPFHHASNSTSVYLIHAMRMFEMTVTFEGAVSAIAFIKALMTEIAIDILAVPVLAGQSPRFPPQRIKLCLREFRIVLKRAPLILAFTFVQVKIVAEVFASLNNVSSAVDVL